MIYLDHSASTPMYPEAVQTLAEISASVWGNPGAIHQAAAPGRKLLNESRRTLASLLKVRDREVFFTSGGTESNNWAIKSGWRYRNRSHIVIGAAEHKSILCAAEAVKALGCEVTLVAPEADGRISPEKIQAAIRPDTGLVSVQAVNNETGAVSDIRAIAAIAHRAKALYHCDGVQSFGHVDLPLECADLISLSAHKFGGPRGVGCLAIRYPAVLPPLLDGGGQELGCRSGTENVAAVAAMAAAARLACEHLPEYGERWTRLRQKLVRGIPEIFPRAVIHGDPEFTSPSILNVRFPGFPAEQMVAWLDLAGICVSPGAACSAQDPTPSHVLLAMGLTPQQAKESIRISLGRDTTEAEIDQTLQALAHIQKTRKPL